MMSKWFSLFAVVVAMSSGPTAFAEDLGRQDVDSVISLAEIQSHVMSEAQSAGLNWRVGDRARYRLSAGLVSGSGDWFVREDTGSGYWTEMIINAGLFGKQKLEIFFDKKTGEMTKVLFNGQLTASPLPIDQDILVNQQTRLTVPAGTFDCTYVKMRNRKTGEISETWSDPGEVPMAGFLRLVGPTPAGRTTLTLQSFSFAR